MFPRCYSTNCSQIWKPKVGAGTDEKGIEARRERHWLVPVLHLSYLNAKLASKGYLILHSRIVTWCVEYYFIDLNQTQIPRCEGHIPKTNLFVFNWSTFFCEKTTNFTYFPHRMGSRFDRWFYKEYALHVALSSWWLFVLFSLPLFVPWAVKVFHNVFTSLLLLLFIFNQQKVTSNSDIKTLGETRH